ncbi:MAG TPA: hypothetical protein VFZ52_22135, partial [Chryseolinea sp.]
MNTKTILTLFLISFFAFNSCDEAILDIEPGGPTEESYFSEEIEFTRGIYGLYAKLTDFYWYNAGQDNCVIPVTYLPGDDITTAGQDEFEIFSNLNPASGRISYFYQTAYQLISR